MNSKITVEEEQKIIKELENFDTPNITNVVATYPGNKNCLELYDAWNDNWYTDDTLKCMYPQLGRRCGYAVTCTYRCEDKEHPTGLGIGDVLRAIEASPKPVVLVIKQDFPERIRHKIGLCGGNMATVFNSTGCVCIISDGPSRDVDEVREIGIQYMLTGVTPGHGPIEVSAVNTPVSVCGMDVTPGDIIHTDENGAVKFPREYLPQVLENCRILNEQEEYRMKKMSETDDVEKLIKYMNSIYE